MLRTFFFSVLFLQVLPSATPARRVAITIDDGPVVNEMSDLASFERVSSGLIESLRAEKVPATIFINERQLNVPGQRDARVAVLERWLDAGFELGNHTYSHSSANRVALPAFGDDIVKGEVITRALLERRGRTLVWFRYPYLHSGTTPEIHQGVVEFLGQRGYRIAPVTVDYADYAFAGAFRDQLRAGASEMASRIKAAYLAQIDVGFDYAEKAAIEVFGKQVPQILLIHCNELNSLTLRESIARIRARGYQFITLEEAMREPVYQRPDTFTGPGGSWLSRSAAALGKVISVTNARVPDWIGGLTRRTDAAADRNWPQWRGPRATGVAPLANPPTEWSETKNVSWKVEIPGRGSSTPIIWDDQVFLTTAIPVGSTGAKSHEPRGGVTPLGPHRFVVMAIDRATGRTRWERVAREEAPHEASHQDNGTWASSSAITDGEIVIASFESRGIYAYDLKGNPVWQTDLGDKRMRNQFGEGSTPALHGNYLVVVWDHQGGSFITALDKRTGKEVWRQAREEIDTWATPLIVEHAGRAQVIVSGMNRIRSYDLETGRLVWHTAGVTMNPIPSPVSSDGMVFVTSGFRGNSLKAVRLADASGDITGTPAIAWTLDRDTPYVPSPLLYDGTLYLLKSNNGLLTALDAKNGTPQYQIQRLEKTPNVFASPVGAAGRIYVAGRDGTTVVLRHGPKFEVLAENTLDDGFDASPALVGNEIFLRGYKSLYRIADAQTNRSIP